MAMCQSANAAVRVRYGINHDEPRAVAPRLLHHRPQVNVVAVNVRGPGDDQPGQPEVLGGRAQLTAVNEVPGLSASLGTDGAVKLARAQAMKEAPVHGAVAQQAHVARVAVGQDRLRAVALRCLVEARGDAIERLVPGHALERLHLAAARLGPLGRTGLALQRNQHAIRRVHAVEILGHFAAQKSLRDRVRGIALHLDGAALCVHGHQHAAGVRAIERADSVHDAKRRIRGSCGHGLIVC